MMFSSTRPRITYLIFEKVTKKTLNADLKYIYRNIFKKHWKLNVFEKLFNGKKCI